MITVIGTLEKVEAVCPDGPFRKDLRRYRESIFLELPEAMHPLWCNGAAVFIRHFPEDESKWEAWMHEADKIWIEKQWQKETRS